MSKQFAKRLAMWVLNEEFEGGTFADIDPKIHNGPVRVMQYHHSGEYEGRYEVQPLPRKGHMGLPLRRLYVKPHVLKRVGVMDLALIHNNYDTINH